MVMAGRREHFLEWMPVSTLAGMDAGFSLLETVLALFFTTLVALTGITVLAQARRVLADGLLQTQRMQGGWVLQQRLADDMHAAVYYTFRGDFLSVTDSRGNRSAYTVSKDGLLYRSVNGYGTVVLATGVATVAYAQLPAGGIWVRVSYGGGASAFEQDFVVPFALGSVG